MLSDAVDDGNGVAIRSNTGNQLRVIAALAEAGQSAALDDDVEDAAAKGGALLAALLEAFKAATCLNEEHTDNLPMLDDAWLTQVNSINQVNPMTWVGQGILALA